MEDRIIDIRQEDTGRVGRIIYGDDDSQYIRIDYSSTPICLEYQQDMDVADAKNLILALQKAIQLVSEDDIGE